MSRNSARSISGGSKVTTTARMTKGRSGWGKVTAGLLDAMRVRNARIVTGQEQEPMDRLTNRQASSITRDERAHRNRRRAMQMASRRKNRRK